MVEIALNGHQQRPAFVVINEWIPVKFGNYKDDKPEYDVQKSLLIYADALERIISGEG